MDEGPYDEFLDIR